MRPPFSATYASAAGRNGSRVSSVDVRAPVINTCMPANARTGLYPSKVVAWPQCDGNLRQRHACGHMRRKGSDLLGTDCVEGLGAQPWTMCRTPDKGMIKLTSRAPSWRSAASLDSVFTEIMPCQKTREHRTAKIAEP